MNTSSHKSFAHAALRYAGSDIDRAGVQRKDAAWVAARLQQADTWLVPVWRNRNLIAGMGAAPAEPTAVLLSRSAGEALLDRVQEPLFLGLRDQRAVFALDISPLDEAEAASAANDYAFADLRVAGPLLSASDAALCAYARGLAYWHRHNPYCNECGHRTHSDQGGHMRKCDRCEHVIFPRTDPAVIMLVVCDTQAGPARCLLGRDPRWPAGTYSTLAGFVEPGESLEEAVAREVFEETGVRVHDVRYMSSQPWPFPASIMLGFRAQADSMALHLDAEEVEDAQWFSAEEITGFGEWGDEHAKLQVPRRDSIARFLIDTWVAEQLGD